MLKKASEYYTKAANTIRHNFKEGQSELFKQLLFEEALIYIRLGSTKDCQTQDITDCFNIAFEKILSLQDRQQLLMKVTLGFIELSKNKTNEIKEFNHKI